MIRLQPSRLRDYLVCPRQYRLKYVDRRQAPPLRPTPALSLGSSLHRALANFHRPDQSFQGPPADLLARHWQRGGYGSAGQEAAYYALGVHALSRYVSAPEHHQGRVLGTEVYLAHTVVNAGRRVELSGRLDRLTLLPDDVLEILDYKSNRDGNAPPRDELAQDLPAFVGYLLVRLAYPDRAHVVVAQLNLMTLDKTTVDYTEGERASNKARLLAIVDALEQHDYPLRLGPHCAWCPVRPQCPAYAAEASLAEL